LPEDPVLRADIEHVLHHGYVIISNAFTKAEAKEARDEIVRLLGDEPLGGRNNFEGINTNRIYSLLNKSRVFDKFTIWPRVLALNDYFLDPGYLLSALHTISTNPGEKAQALHHDDGYIQFHQALSASSQLLQAPMLSCGMFHAGSVSLYYKYQLFSGPG